MAENVGVAEAVKRAREVSVNTPIIINAPIVPKDRVGLGLCIDHETHQNCMAPATTRL